MEVGSVIMKARGSRWSELAGGCRPQSLGGDASDMIVVVVMVRPGDPLTVSAGFEE